MKAIDVIIIGSGPAGLYAAKSFENTELTVLLLEATERVAQKLLISGGGQCNYTNIIDIKDFYNKYGDNGKFLKPAFYKLDNKSTINYFKSKGIDTFVNDLGKVFPKTLKATDILDALLKDCRIAGVKIERNKRVTHISKVEEGEGFLVSGDKFAYSCKRVLIAAGGNSYQHTGSKGDGIKLAARLGCSVVDIKPALAPVFIDKYKFTTLAGISFKDICITIYRKQKKLMDIHGDLLFTHKNLSGPVILNNSRYFEVGDEFKINFMGISYDEFRKKLMTLINDNGKLNIKTILLKEFDVPRRFIELLLDISCIDHDIRCGELKKEQRNSIIRNLTEYSVFVNKLGDFKNSMVTKGGVSLSAINKKTMESKEVKGLYLAGEVMDIDGDTGGFNIQAAFSTGYLAAHSIIKDLKEE